jgi:uncharacterized protein GlcG (DUF336 family)
MKFTIRDILPALLIIHLCSNKFSSRLPITIFISFQSMIMQINSTQCSKVFEEASKRAENIGVAANIAILDKFGYLKSFLRMDNALLGSIDIALGKAKTAMLFRMNSESVGEFLHPSHETYGMVNTSGGLVAFKGGMAIQSDGVTIGYIGVSGGSPEQDFEIATAGSRI